MSPNLKNIIIYILILIIGVFIGGYSVNLYFKTKIQKIFMSNVTSSESVNNDVFDNNAQASNSKILKTKYFVGDVVSFSGDTIIIDSENILYPLSVSKEKHQVTVKIDNNTKFISTTLKDKAIFEKEMRDYKNIPIDKRAQITSPKSLIEKEIPRNSISVGKKIVIKSKEELVSTTKYFVAESISLTYELSKATN